MHCLQCMLHCKFIPPYLTLSSYYDTHVLCLLSVPLQVALLQQQQQQQPIPCPSCHPWGPQIAPTPPAAPSAVLSLIAPPNSSAGVVLYCVACSTGLNTHTLRPLNDQRVDTMCLLPDCLPLQVALQQQQPPRCPSCHPPAPQTAPTPPAVPSAVLPLSQQLKWNALTTCQHAPANASPHSRRSADLVRRLTLL